MHLHQVQVHYSPRAMADELDDEVLAAWRGLLNAHAHITRRINRDLADAGLPDLRWYDLLWALRRQPEQRLRVNQLAREVVLSRTAMSRFVDRAERAGTVRREPDPDDRRAQQVVLTGVGLDLLRRMWPVYAAGIARHFGEPLGGDAGAARELLERIAEAARNRS
jgi:DNA-binding MarR family transcriptional regulator